MKKERRETLADQASKYGASGGQPHFDGNKRQAYTAEEYNEMVREAKSSSRMMGIVTVSAIISFIISVSLLLSACLEVN